MRSHPYFVTFRLHSFWSCMTRSCLTAVPRFNLPVFFCTKNLTGCPVALVSMNTWHWVTSTQLHFPQGIKSIQALIMGQAIQTPRCLPPTQHYTILVYHWHCRGLLEKFNADCHRVIIDRQKFGGISRSLQGQMAAVGGSSLKDSNLHLNGHEFCKPLLKGNYLEAKKINGCLNALIWMQSRQFALFVCTKWNFLHFLRLHTDYMLIS